MDLAAIQAALRARSLDAWLFYDHHHHDAIAYRVLGLSEDALVSRRWYYLIPAQGAPRKLVHRIESGQLDSLPGEKVTYSAWTELQSSLRDLLTGFGRVAMQYSPNNMIPVISLVDAGTVELLRGFGTRIVSSGDLVAQFEATWDPRALDSHREAGRVIDAAIADAFREIRKFLDAGGHPTESDIQQFLVGRLHEDNVIFDDPPIVAVNANAGNPHYEPPPGAGAPIGSDDLVLLDVFGKMNYPGSVYYDVTWVGHTGRPPKKMEEVFRTVRSARDEAFSYVRNSIEAGQRIRGFQVDRVARGIIDSAGMGEYFIHRTGHSIAGSVHGNGANMDDFETHDEREILPHTCFSVEPGIYLPEFGIRLEVDVYVGEGNAEITGPVQREIVRI
jgi:Xaa-Pro dipeptidase